MPMPISTDEGNMTNHLDTSGSYNMKENGFIEGDKQQ